MDLIGWHTAIANCSLSEKDSFLVGHDPRWMSRSCSGVHDVLACAGDDVIAAFG